MSLSSIAQVSLQSTLSSEEASAVPRNSPCHYVGDPSNDLLSIASLDLEPNPPIDYLCVRLKGNLISDIGPKPVLKTAAALIGTIGPNHESEMCVSKLEITQKGTTWCSPKKGPLEMTYDVIIAYPYIKKGNHTIRVQMDATDGARMTDFEGTVWINGEAGDEDGDD